MADVLFGAFLLALCIYIGRTWLRWFRAETSKDVAMKYWCVTPLLVLPMISADATLPEAQHIELTGISEEVCGGPNVVLIRLVLVM
jgi:hypothetical protein